MKKLYDLARGTVRVKAVGANAESILNLCAENGIEFWDASPCSDFELLFTLHAADYPAVSSRSGKNGVEITLVCSRGGRQLTKSMKSRVMLLVLLCVCIILSAISSLFIWRIDVVGNDKVSAESLLRALDDCGVRYGAFWPAISSDAVKDSVVSTVPEIAWLSLNIRSSCARIVVHERIGKPEIVNEKAPCDIIASKSGVIKQMTVLEGEGQVNPGDTVAKGDILVSALMPSETGDERLVHAMAQVQADTWYEISACVPLYEEKKVKESGGNTGFSIIIGKKRINFFNDSRNKSTSCDKINKLRYISAGDLFVLPLGYAVCKSSDCETELRPIDKPAAVSRLSESLKNELISRINGGQIVSEEYSVSESGELLTVTLRAQCTENIAKEAVYDRENDRS